MHGRGRPPRLPPTGPHILGTDTQGRDLWTELVLGTGNSLKIGFIAGFVGIGIGLLLGLIAGFVGGATDTVIRIIADALLTVPAIAVLVVLAANVEQMTVEMMGVAIALLAWMFPTRVIRSQVLTIRQRSYVEVAKANGVGTAGLIFKEVMPNLMPWVLAAFVAYRLRGDPRGRRPRGDRAGRQRCPYARGQHLLGAVLFRDGARVVVVVDPADHHDRLHLHDAVPGLGRDGPLRQPASATRMTPRHPNAQYIRNPPDTFRVAPVM